jgi:PAT family beta-lactamase induction signal transducer AmpG
MISRRIAVQGPLGFASGLPLLLTGSTLTARLAKEGVEIETIGMFALIALPYNFKFLWAPLFDRWELPYLGRRRGWMVLFQLALAPALILLGASDPAAASSIAVMALAVAFLSASHDVVFDAYRTDLLEGRELGRGTAAYVVGYRLAMIVGGALALMLSDYWAWERIYWLMALLLLAGVPIVVLAPALPPNSPAPPSLLTAIVDPLREFFARAGAIWALTFVAFYKFGDALAVDLINPFLIHVGFSGTEIGAVQKALGIGATIVGVSAGGWLLDRRDLRRSLVIFGVAQALPNLGYVALALTGKSLTLLIAVAAIDNICNGLGTAAFVAAITALCNRSYSATQYALLTSASSVIARLVGPGSGWAIGRFGWAAFFLLTSVVGLPALLAACRSPFSRGEIASSTLADSRADADSKQAARQHLLHNEEEPD